MYRCKTCGGEIDEHQFKNYNGLCSHCIRIQKSSAVTKDTGRSLVLQDKIKGNETGMGYIGGCIFVAFIITIFGLLSNIIMGLFAGFVLILLILWFIHVFNKNKELKKELRKLM